MEGSRYDVIILRPCLKTYVVLDGIWILLLALGIATLLVCPNSNVWSVKLLFCGCLAFTHVWIRSHNVELSEKEIRYRTLFGENAIAVADVSDYDFEVGSRGYWESRLRADGLYRLAIRSHNADAKPIIINATLFSPASLGKLLEFIGARKG